MRSADRVLAHAQSSSPTLGEGRLLCVDGPAGSGKTTLAAEVAELAAGARVVHMDDLYDGWSGLPRLADQLDALLLPLARGLAGSYRRYDWHAARFAETVSVEPVELLILEGVGSGSLRHASLVTTLVWVSAPSSVRVRRGIERDGAEVEPLWRQWMVDEAAHFVRERTREQADIVVDGTGSIPPVIRHGDPPDPAANPTRR